MKVSPRSPRGRAEALVAQPWEWLPPATVAGELASSLADAPLFAGVARQAIVEALANFDEARYPSGRRVLVEGLRGSDFFLIVTGTVAVAIDGWRLATLGPGDFFGEMAILGAGLRTASVRAETPLHCLVLPNGKLETLLLDHPQLGINVLHALVSRFTNLTGRRQPPASELAG
ncbi:MAG TPA: cyclic nucleotide-binding domain-containing protein [Candidatus Dormibacteraeota bacterium]|jgi:CRP-like cAMP-binding protein|nr:cyclic nucleotide-binding domain-containing protein [Candidatus Dormibacteraeota bacterium]